jgi:hypothetical protein
MKETIQMFIDFVLISLSPEKYYIEEKKIRDFSIK